VNQEESEQNEVDGVKKGVDSTGAVLHVTNVWAIGLPVFIALRRLQIFFEYSRSK